MGLKLYSVSDGPTAIAVNVALRYLGLDYGKLLIYIKTGFHLTEKYDKINPQHEMPVLNDDSFISEEGIYSFC